MSKAYAKVKLECPDCGATRMVHPSGLTARKSTLCITCFNSKRTGEKSSTWRGGCRQYSKGRFGKDKDGLSWKVQRTLARERDDFTCQHCRKKVEGWKPDVHHKVPWMNSHSHHLDNLICLCRKCHLIEEAKVQGQWGGQLVERPPSTRVCGCGKRLQYLKWEVDGRHVCAACHKAPIKAEVQRLRAAGMSLNDIVRRTGLSMGTAFNYSKHL